ncbi:hypothetical protein FRB90_010633, partial [Tulasnella sp. 427]
MDGTSPFIPPPPEQHQHVQTHPPTPPLSPKHLAHQMHRPQLESHSSGGSSVTLTPKSSVPTPPTPGSSENPSSETGASTSSTTQTTSSSSLTACSSTPSITSRPLPKKKTTRKPTRPATAPTGEASSRQPLLPAHSPSTLQSLLPADDEPTSRPSTGDATTITNLEPLVVGEMLEPVTRRPTRLPSRFGAIPDLKRELDETVIDGVTVPPSSLSSGITSTASPRPDPTSPRAPGQDWPFPAASSATSPPDTIEFEPRDWQAFMRA